MSFLKRSYFLMFLFLAAAAKADEAPDISLKENHADTNRQEEITFHCQTGGENSSEKQKSAASSEEDKNSSQPVQDEAEDVFEEQEEGLEEESLMLNYNFASRIDVKDPWDVFLEAGYIYWQIKEKGLDYGLLVPSDTANEVQKTAQLSFEYQSGFKVALGTNFEHDNWTALIIYTRLHGKEHNSESSPSGGYINPFYIHNSNIGNEASHLKAHWGLSYDILNLEIARPCYAGTHLLLRPYIGMTGGWIDQTLLSIGTFLTDTFTIFGKCYSDSWLIGPRAGIDSRWLIGWGFDIKGNLAAGLPYQKIKSCFKQQNEYYDYSLAWRIKERIGQITPVLEAALGFGWGTYFDDHKWHFSFNALYEFLYYFDQNQMRKITDMQLRDVVTKPGDLMLQGLSVSLRMDF